MNTQRLLELVSELDADEKHYAIQKALNQVSVRLQALASNPQDTGSQLEASKKIDELRSILQTVEADYSPAFLDRMDAIGALPFFTTRMTDRLDASVAANAMTPATAHQDAQELVKQRNDFIERIADIKDGLMELGFDDDGLATGEAEIGFQIPRAIFNNELGGLAKELQELRVIVRAFSELAGNAGEPIEVRQISTTDPIFFVMVGIVTVRLLGQAVAWSLQQWKTVEEVRHIRAQTAALNVGAATETLVAQFDEVIHQKIKAEVEAEALRLLGSTPQEAGRQHELRNHVEMALQGILARVERGMTVELRLGPPAAVENEDDEESSADTSEEQSLYEELSQLRNQLSFPKPSGEPVLALSRMAAANDSDDQR